MSRRSGHGTIRASGRSGALLLIMLLLAGPEPETAGAASADRVFANYRRLTTVAVRCPERSQPDEVVVCGRRRADRYRLPFEPDPVPGDPRREGVHAERERLQGKKNNCAEKSAFLVGCGMAGVSVTVNSRGARAGGLRELSP